METIENIKRPTKVEQKAAIKSYSALVAALSHIKEVETEMGTFKLQKINYDEAGEVVSHLKIAAIPLLVLYKEGKEVWKHNGTIEKAALKKIIQQYQ